MRIERKIKKTNSGEYTMMTIQKIFFKVNTVELNIKGWMIQFFKKIRIDNYLKSDRRPWRPGYYEYRNEYLRNALNNKDLMISFKDLTKLPDKYGYRLDARVVEIPWVLSRLPDKEIKLLDAGSSLNNEVVIDAPSLANKKLTILTLAPEGACFWNKGVSYFFGDLRDLDFKDGTFDSIICISTIEHVGMDNSMYDPKNSYLNSETQNDFIIGIKELKRVLKTGGALFCTFPFGKYQNHGWFRQFDSRLMDILIEEFKPAKYTETIFKYNPDGWEISNRESCAECEFFDVHTSKYFDPQSTIEYPADFPAGERAVACLELFK
jgi:SAM-dependent methyltransferase